LNTLLVLNLHYRSDSKAPIGLLRLPGNSLRSPGGLRAFITYHDRFSRLFRACSNQWYRKLTVATPRVVSKPLIQLVAELPVFFMSDPLAFETSI